MPVRKTQYKRGGPGLAKRTRGRPRGSTNKRAAANIVRDEDEDSPVIAHVTPATDDTWFSFGDEVGADEPSNAAKKSGGDKDDESFWTWLGF